MKVAADFLSTLLPVPLASLPSALTAMPTAPDNPAAHDYAERIRERLPSRLQELREVMGLSNIHLSPARAWLSGGIAALPGHRDRGS